jgi:hypothetical protein
MLLLGLRGIAILALFGCSCSSVRRVTFSGDTSRASIVTL